MESAVVGFEEEDYSCKGWDEIRVPAHIQMEGYDVPHYTNTTYPWEANEFIFQEKFLQNLIQWRVM